MVASGRYDILLYTLYSIVKFIFFTFLRLHQVNFLDLFLSIFVLFFFSFRLNNIEELTRATIKKLTQGMAEHNKSMAAAKTDEAKEKIVSLILESGCPCYYCHLSFLCFLLTFFL